jgi:hypothetical protein
VYRLEHQGSTEKFETRGDAARRAKALTAESNVNVTVTDERGVLRMVYRRGALDSFSEDSGRKPPPREPREPREPRASRD